MASVSKISVFAYFDYVEYLRDLLNNLQGESGASLRSIQNALGVKGSAFFTRILDGSRPLSIENSKNISEALGFNTAEKDYFTNLVKFGNEKNVDKREDLLKKLLAARRDNQEATQNYALKDSALQFFGKWYYPVIRDLLPLLPESACKNKDTLAQKIGRMMIPALKANQVQGAIDYLIENGFIENHDGRFVVSEPIISTPPRVRSTLLRKYHLKNLEINSEVYDALDGNERSVSSVTCSLSKESFEKVRLEIAQFRDKILAIAREDRNPDRVCHLGIQFVPRAILKDASKDDKGGDSE